MAEPFLQAATQAPQPMQVAQSMASSASVLGMRMALASWGACAYADVAAGCLDLVEGGAVYHAVLDDGEGCGAPGFNGDDVAVVEAAHVELAGGSAGFGLAVGRTVDVERAHTADAFAAVVVEDEGFFAFADEFFVEDVEHLEERGVVGDVVHLTGVEVTRILGAILLPVLDCERYVLSHG